MPDICVFYAREDKKRIEVLVRALTEKGWNVWWDKEIYHGKWPSHIEKAVSAARCVIPIWSRYSINPDNLVINETKLAQELGKDILPLRINKVKLPLLFNTLHTVDLMDVNKENVNDNFQPLIISIEKIIGPPPNIWSGERLSTISVDGLSISLPCFIRSVSSFETQLPPVAALTALSLVPSTDPVLVSAYDVYLSPKADNDEIDNHKKIVNLINGLKKRNCLTLMDSGKYEAARKNKLKWWTYRKYLTATKQIQANVTFSFDNLEPSKNIKMLVADVVKRSRSGKNNRLPIVHAPVNKLGQRQYNKLPIIYHSVDRELHPPFIAVPERELGAGIWERAATIRNIRKELENAGRYIPIHLLGTGNPISILIYAIAGADLFDGLEWCRTTVDRGTGLLYHHQQYPFFIEQTITMANFKVVQEAAAKKDINPLLKMALHNLDFFHKWMDDLRFYISNGQVMKLLEARLSTHTFFGDIKKNIEGILS